MTAFRHRRLRALLAATACAALLGAAPAYAAGGTDCELTFELSGWSVFYKTASGNGRVNCDNGQSMPVHIETRGGGLTFGKTRIEDGRGEFSGVADISEVLGTYVTAEAHAGAVNSAKAQVMTKGEVSLALAGTGRGWSLGVAFGKFVISPR
jgi:hypothetical protein